MHLWSEYEGRTIAGAYNLEKLLRSEGRNAFFTTSDKKKDGAVIRLTEAHFDEEEMLKRWRHVAAVDQHNLLSIREVGQTKVDDVAVAYALLEPNDGSLAEVLRERPLTPAEALQVASSVVSALTVLHASGLVHEHVQTANILAVGETVKLRSDCVRECVADQEFTTSAQCDELRLRDIHDLGTVLLQCLTLEPEWKPSLALPSPFAQLIPGALDGSWNLERIASVLTAAEEAANRKMRAAMPPPAVTPNVNHGLSGSQPRIVPRAVPSTPLHAVQNNVLPIVPAEVLGARAVEPSPRAAEFETASAQLAGRLSQRRQIVAPEPPRSSTWKWMLAFAGVVVLLLVWHFFGGKPARPAAAAPVSPAPIRSSALPSSPVIPAPSAGPIQAARAADGWYVVAYTYNHKDQAEGKVVSLKRIHNSLRPQVFSPSGQAPFLVTLGGRMNHQQADDVLKHAHRAGMPRDTFVRNY